MSSRITEKDLEEMAEHINRLTGSPLEQYTQTADGTDKANVGNYHISYAYGGVGLHRMVNTGGGVTTIIGGYTPKRELYEKMRALITGIGVSRGV